MVGDAALSTLGMLMSGGAQFVLSVVVGRVFGAGTLGAVRGALSLANTASLLWPSAAGQSASLFVARELAADRAEVAGQVERHLTLRVALAVLVLAPTMALASVFVLGLGWGDAAWVAALVVALDAFMCGHGRVRVLDCAALEDESALHALAVPARRLPTAHRPASPASR